jgi:hypothetical protein
MAKLTAKIRGSQQRFEVESTRGDHIEAVGSHESAIDRATARGSDVEGRLADSVREGDELRPRLEMLAESKRTAE